MKLEIVYEKGVLTVMLFGELDHHTALAARNETDTVIERVKPERVLLDFGGVTFMDSSGIGFVMGRYRLAMKLGAETEVVNAGSAIYKIMKLSGLERIVKLTKKGA